VRYISRGLVAVILIISVLFLFSPHVINADEIDQAPADPDISDICTLSDCNPAKPCADSNESCYTVNGAFYCCIEPPSGGAEAVGE